MSRSTRICSRPSTSCASVAAAPRCGRSPRARRRAWIACTSASRALRTRGGRTRSRARRGDGPRRAREPARVAPRDGRRPRAASARPLIGSASPLLQPDALLAHPRGCSAGPTASSCARTASTRTSARPTLVDGDEELAWVMTRYRQVHDLWHVLCGLPPSVLDIRRQMVRVCRRACLSPLSAVVGPLAALVGATPPRARLRPVGRARRPPRGAAHGRVVRAAPRDAPRRAAPHHAGRAGARRAGPRRRRTGVSVRPASHMPTVCAPCGAECRCHGAKVDFPVRRR